jgi:hypothetical protein
MKQHKVEQAKELLSQWEEIDWCSGSEIAVVEDPNEKSYYESALLEDHEDDHGEHDGGKAAASASVFSLLPPGGGGADPADQIAHAEAALENKEENMDFPDTPDEDLKELVN